MFPKFRVAAYLFHFLAEEDLVLPRNKSNLMRGALGAAWVRYICPHHHKKQQHDKNCGFLRWFRGSVVDAPKVYSGESNLPSWTLYCPTEGKKIQKGEIITLVMTFFGLEAVTDGFVHFVIAAESIKSIGPKGDQGSIKLYLIEAFSPYSQEAVPVYNSGTGEWGSPLMYNWAQIQQFAGFWDSSLLRLDFFTPTRIITGGDLVKIPAFDIVFEAHLRRALAILQIHCSEDVSEVDVFGLLELSKQVELVESEVKWVDWSRRSARQKSTMNLGGFVGSAVYSGDFKPFEPWLALIPWLSVGKATTFGNGVAVTYNVSVQTLDSL